MANSPECPRAGKWIGGCRFEPVKIWVGLQTIYINATGESKVSVTDLPAAEQKFVAMACTRCGMAFEYESE